MVTVQITPGPRAIEQALAGLPEGGPAELLLMPGVYHEKLTLARPHTTLRGSGADCTVITWDDGAFTLLEDGLKRGTFRTATLMLDGDDITLKGLTVENAAAPREKAGQAIALYADGDGILVEDCCLKGHQDTLFTAPLPLKEMEKRGFIGPKELAPRRPQRQTYRRCSICGDVDFIFGGAAAWFEECDIIAVDGRENREGEAVGFCAAPSTPEGQRHGYVFSRCRFMNGNFPEGSVYLARPWREHARIVLLNCELGPHIRPEGFHDWGKEAFHRCGFAAEWGSSGPGAAGTRAAYAHRLRADEAAEYTYERWFATALDIIERSNAEEL